MSCAWYAALLTPNRSRSAIIISGGPGSCYEPGAPAFDKAVLSMGLPVLGVCYGYQVRVCE